MTTTTTNAANAGLICEECSSPIASVVMTVDDRTATIEDYLLSPCGHHAGYVVVPIETS